MIIRALKPESLAASFDLRSGLLTWDAGTAQPSRHVYRGGLYAFQLATGRREQWLLPVEFDPQTDNDDKSTFGYSTHTANMVFWLADASASEDNVSSVDRWTVFAARLKTK